MAGSKIILHFTEMAPWEETAPNSPRRNWVLSKGIGILNQGLQVYCWAVCFCFLPHQLREVHVHIYIQHCLHPRTTPVWEAMLGRDRPAGPLRSHHITIKWPRECGDPKLVVWSSSSLKWCPKCSRAKQDQKALPTRRQAGHKERQRVGTGFGGLGFFPCFLKQMTPYSPLPSPLVLRQLHSVDHWELGFIQHLKICSLRLLLEALAKFLTNKHLPAKLKMELLIKWIMYLITCWFNWFSLTSGREDW